MTLFKDTDQYNLTSVLCFLNLFFFWYFGISFAVGIVAKRVLPDFRVSKEVGDWSHSIVSWSMSTYNFTLQAYV